MSDDNRTNPRIELPTFKKKEKKERKKILPWLFGGNKSGAALVNIEAGVSGSSAAGFAGRLGILASAKGLATTGGLLGTKFGAILGMLATAGIIAAAGIIVTKWDFRAEEIQNANFIDGLAHNFRGDIAGNGNHKGSNAAALNSKDSLSMFAQRNRNISGADLKNSKVVNLSDEQMPETADEEAKQVGVSVDHEAVVAPTLKDMLGGSQYSYLGGGGGGIGGAGGYGDGSGTGRAGDVGGIALPGTGNINPALANLGKGTVMKQPRRFGYTKSRGGRVNYGGKALSQAAGIRSSMARVNYSDTGAMRQGTDDAWDGSVTVDTGVTVPGSTDSDTGTGTGTTDGSDGTIKIPDFDIPTVEVSAPDTNDESPNVSSSGSDDSPWEETSDSALDLITIACILVALIAVFAAMRNIPIIGWLMFLIAIALFIALCMVALQMMGLASVMGGGQSQQDQSGMMTIVGVVMIAAGAIALCGVAPMMFMMVFGIMGILGALISAFMG